MAYETSETKPTDEDWSREIERFRIYRDLETDTDVMKRAEQLSGRLREEAAPIYDVANTLDRTLVTNADLTKFRANLIVERVERKGYAGDAFWDHVWGELRDHLPQRVSCSASALRQIANALVDAAEDAQFTLDYYYDSLKKIRDPSGKGDYPSVAWHSLIAAADRWKVTNSEIAKRLVDANVPSDSNSLTVDLHEQWMRILKKARPRARAQSKRQ